MDPPEWEFYDLKNDPVEFINLADSGEHGERIARMKSALLEWRAETGDPLLTEEGVARFKSLGDEARKRSGR